MTAHRKIAQVRDDAKRARAAGADGAAARRAGELGMEWPRVHLGRLLALEYGKGLTASQRNVNGPFLVAGSNGPDGTHSEAFVAGPGIVVGRKGSAGKVYWYDTDFWPIDTTYYVVLKLPLDTRWTYYLLRQLRLERLATTTGVPGLNRNDAYTLEAPYPPLSEQRRIVEILDQADRLRRLRAEADAKAERILPALLARVLGAPGSWASDPRSRALGDLIDPLSGATPSKNVTEYWNGDVSWVSPKDMKRDFLSDSQDHVSRAAVDGTNLAVVEPDNVLIVVRGMILARDVPVAVNLCQVTINQDMKALVPKTTEVTGSFLWAALRLARTGLQSLVRTAGHGTRKLDTPELMQFPVVVPSPGQLARVDSAVSQHRHLIDQRQARRALVDRLFGLLLGRAFEGSLTASWREGHITELVQEMEHQAKVLAASARSG